MVIELTMAVISHIECNRYSGVQVMKSSALTLATLKCQICKIICDLEYLYLDDLRRSRLTQIAMYDHSHLCSLLLWLQIRPYDKTWF